VKENTGNIAGIFLSEMRLLMRILPVIAMALLLSGCGSIISRTVPGRGMAISITPACSGMFAIRHGATHHSRSAVLAGVRYVAAAA
jgi:uncharacterized protein YceK